MVETGNIEHYWDHFTSSAFSKWRLGTFLIFKILNKVELISNKGSLEDFIGTSFGLIDADLLLVWMSKFQLCFSFRRVSCPVLLGTSFGLIDADLLLVWMNKFQLCFSFRRVSCPVLPAMLIISQGECIRPYIVSLYQILSYLDQWKQMGQRSRRMFYYMGNWAGGHSFAFWHGWRNINVFNRYFINFQQP